VAGFISHNAIPEEYGIDGIIGLNFMRQLNIGSTAHLSG